MSHQPSRWSDHSAHSFGKSDFSLIVLSSGTNMSLNAMILCDV